jgi:hypothetical protein
MERWLEAKRPEVAGRTLSPTYFGELERYAAPGGDFAFFEAISIHELISTAYSRTGARGGADAESRRRRSAMHWELSGPFLAG